MDLRVVLASACIAFLAVLLWEMIPSMLIYETSMFADGLRNSMPQNSILDHVQEAANQEAWDVLYHLGGNGPWIKKVRGIVHHSVAPPPGCRVDQIHMISRHAERYPTVAAGVRMLYLYQHIREANVTLIGDLSFANDWKFFTDDPAAHFENLISIGPYAGSLEAFTAGVKLRTRYKDLLDEAVAAGPVSFRASDSERVIDTAKYFGAGFFGIDWQDKASLHVIPETADRGADSLTPGRTCLKYRNNTDTRGHQYGYRMMDMIRSTYEPAIVQRLQKQNPDIVFAEGEVFTMQLLCGFETMIKGSSPWCGVFHQHEMESFEYARDVIHYYRAGPGNPYSASMGWLWLNATANLLSDGPERGPLFMSFVHDGDIMPLLSALDLFPQYPDLPISGVLHNRTWHTSDVIPMGGRIIFERLACAVPPDCWSNAPFYPNHVYCEPQADEIYVRINVNDGIVAIPGCDEGPGSSCSLVDFLERVRRRGNDIVNFRSMCGLDDSAPQRITFLHQ